MELEWAKACERIARKRNFEISKTSNVPGMSCEKHTVCTVCQNSPVHTQGF